MIRTLWYYVVLLVSTVVHAVGTIGAALLGVRHRSGGVYDWGTRDWSRWILRAAGTSSSRVASASHTPARSCTPRITRPCSTSGR